MKSFYELRFFLILWLTQAFSSLGSAMTNFALVLWLYQDSGSALKTAMLTVCSYAPYVLLSIFAGVISDRWNKKAVMLVCDSVAAAGTLVIVLLLQLHLLAVWHLYLLNACNGLMNAVQSPASDVATTLLTPKKYYQKTSGLRSFSNSLVSMLTPVLATAFFAFGGLKAVIAFDLSTFAVAFLVLLLWISIPEVPHTTGANRILFAGCQGGAGLSAVEPRYFLADFVFIQHQFDCFYASGSPSSKNSATAGRNRFGHREQLCWICHAARQLAGSVLSETEK